MKKKTLFFIILMAVLIIAIVILALVINKNHSSTALQSYDSVEEAVENANFDLLYSDRVAGYPATSYKSNDNTVEVLYGDKAFTRKTYGNEDNSGITKDYSEVAEHDINGMKVTFKGENGLVFLAVWNYNGYSYSIGIDDDKGVNEDDMTEYVSDTR